MSFAYKPAFLATFAATFETLKDGGLVVTIDDDKPTHVSLTGPEAIELRDFLVKNITDDAT